jgi:hypothetical protein
MFITKPIMNENIISVWGHVHNLYPFFYFYHDMFGSHNLDEWNMSCFSSSSEMQFESVDLGLARIKHHPDLVVGGGRPSNGEY